MKIQIDTDRKTIKLESNVLISKLLETLKALFPNNEWKKFTLETNTVINNWSNPIVIGDYPSFPAPYVQPYPWYQWNSVLCSASSNSQSSGKQTAEYKVDKALSKFTGAMQATNLKSGTFNIEV